MNLHLRIDSLQIDARQAPANPDASLGAMIARRLSIKKTSLLDFRILGKSVDARRGAPMLVYSLVAVIRGSLKQLPAGWVEVTQEEYDGAGRIAEPALPLFQGGAEEKRPVIVGTGPAGIFAALLLARAGMAPLVLDRGFPVDERMLDQQKFLESRELNEESNLLIGEGGAGTFSDGKLYTRVKDPWSGFVLKTYVDAGASNEILYLKRPHIGSDYLPEVARNMRKMVEAAGGEFRFGCGVTDLVVEDGRVSAVILASGERIDAGRVILAHGLGGRDLTEKLIAHDVAHKLKGFQIGCRIEHPQLLIDRRQYRMEVRPASLGSAEYQFSMQNDAGIGVSSFCMCPGGEIVMASAWRNRLTSNGMSRFERDLPFANSCLIMTIRPERFGSPHAAMRFLERHEKAAFEAGGGDYTMPAQSAHGFLTGQADLIREESSCQTGICAARLDLLLGEELREPMRLALKDFDRKCPGFIREGQFAGIESCVSSPVMFQRDPETLASSVKGVYLAGEGAGAAGGIMSAAIDGLRIAERILFTAKK